MLSHVITLPPTEVVQVLQAIAGTPTGGAMACRFLQAKWYDLESKMGAGSINFAKVISAITQYGATKFDYDEVRSMPNSEHCSIAFSLTLIDLIFDFPVKIAGTSIRRWAGHDHTKYDIEKCCRQCGMGVTFTKCHIQLG